MLYALIQNQHSAVLDSFCSLNGGFAFVGNLILLFNKSPPDA